MPDIVLLIVAAILLGVGAVLTHRYPKSAWPHGAGIVALIVGAVLLAWWVITALLLTDADAGHVHAALAAIRAL